MPDPFVRIDILYWLKTKKVQEGPTKVRGMFPVRDIFRDMQLVGHEVSIVERELNYLIKRGLVVSETLCSSADKNDLVKIALPGSLHLRLLKNVTYLAACAEDVLFKDVVVMTTITRRLSSNAYTSKISMALTANEMINYLSEYKKEFCSFPEQYISDKEKIEMFESKEEKDFSKSCWGEILLKNLREEITDAINSLTIIKEKLQNYYELEKYKQTIESDIEYLQNIYVASEISWDKAFESSQLGKFKTWPVNKKITLEIKDEAKVSRNKVKDKIMGAIKSILTYNSERAYNDIYEMYEILRVLKDVILEFDKKIKEKKREKNIIDFNDIEHYALKILVKKDENGKYIPTDVAKKYQEKFEEIAIDEYQDSNEVQEYILKMVSRGNNLFMVGDVKQSIYKFRQACPQLFLEKYKNYSLDGNDEGLKIQLFKNFRSRKNVLDITNIIFENIMSIDLGDIDYTKEEYLNLGADFEEIENGLGNAELNIIDLKEDEEELEKKEDLDSKEYYTKETISTLDDEENELKLIEKEEIEAKFVAKKIESIINSRKQVKDKKIGIRDIKYKDIVILLRSTSRLAPIYEKELIKRNIPVFSDSSNEYLDTIEIQTIINLLKILDNPIDDIALVSVLRSEIGAFTDNEILEIRLTRKDTKFYESLKAAREELKGELKQKVNNFLENIDSWRKQSDYLSLAELIWNIYTETGFYNYVGLMPNGLLRQANLKMLFERAKEYEKTSFKGIFNFIRFVERLRNGNSDMAAAKVIGENENVVRIMSIHKSKGLEFPVVFLSSTSKKINMQDLNSNLLLHQKIGIGPQYINYEKMIEYSTAAKDAIKIIIKEETIAEEMRVLYVALTRAKEKLIITGTAGDYQKELDKKKEIIKIYGQKNKKINPILLKKYISYLDWIELVYLKNDLKDKIEIYEHKKSEVIEKDEVKEEKIREFDFEKKTDFENFEKEFNWEYKNKLSTELPIKSTVSKIKEMKNEYNQSIQFDSLGKKEIGIESISPSFMIKDEKISNSQKGTLMHLFLQKLNLKQEYNLNELECLKQELISKAFITSEEAEYINLEKIEKFLKSKLTQQIKACIVIEKEKAFCKKVLAKEVYNNAKDETILVQGIIDLYGITNDNKIILVDYKTDFVQEGNEKELVEKYLNQLRIYKEALEEATEKKVSKVYIYSLYLDKEIALEL